MTNERLKAYVARYAALLEEAEENREAQKDLAAEIKSKGEGISAAHVKKLAALTISDKKVTKLRADNATMDRYNRDSGTDLDLGIGVSPLDIAAAAETLDARVVEAIAMLRDRKSIRTVVQALNMGHGTVQRLRAALFAVPTAAVPSDDAGTGTPPHDPATGEITPSPADIASSDGVPTAAAPAPPGPASAGEPDDWEKRDSLATFVLGHAVASGREPHPGEVDTAKTQAVVAACNGAQVTTKEITPVASDINDVGPEYPGERIIPVTTPDDLAIPRFLKAGTPERAAAIAAGSGE